MGVPYLGFTWVAGKGKRMSDCVIWQKRRGMAGEPEVKRREVVKKIEATTLTRRSLPSKGTRRIGITRKEWVTGIALKIQLSGGFGEDGMADLYPINRRTRRGGPQHSVKTEVTLRRRRVALRLPVRGVSGRTKGLQLPHHQVIHG